MLVYLLRHGRAHSASASGVHRDEERALAGAGERELATVIQASAGSLVRPKRILHSPYVRARQTAQILAKGVGFAGILEEHEGLVPLADPTAILPVLADAASSPDTAMALVGHEPFMGRLLAILTTGDTRASIPFATGMLAAVQLAGSSSMVGQLVFARAP